MMVNDLLQGPDLVLQGFLLIAVELVQIIDVSLLFTELLIGRSTRVSELGISILESDLKGLDFFLETIAFAVENLPNSSLFFDELLDFAIFIAKCRVKLVDLVLQAIDILLMIQSHLFDLTFVNLVELDLQGVFF